ncbi:MAG: tetratricopeptide repeat protein [Sulfuricella denitrificans]|nr:tetratricopeptide repeat protein [Sulfuricella denitrificans]
MTTGRNDPCPCGSGKKYKRCCEANRAGAIPAKTGQIHTQPAFNAQAILNEARQFLSKGGLPQAEMLCRKLLGAQPDHPDALHLLGQIAHRVGKNEEARKLVEQAVLLRPGNMTFRLELANIQYDLAHFDDAIAAAEEILKRKPDSFEARFTLALALRGQGRLAECIAQYRKLLARQAQNFAVLLNLGAALKTAGEKDEALLEEALLVLGKAVRVNPDSAHAHCMTGVVLNLQGRYEEAIAALKRALALDPNNADAHCNLGVILQMLGETESALQHLSRAIALSPRMAAAHWGLSPVLLVSGDIAAGWEKYEWRLSALEGFCRPFPQPWWQGESLAGKTLLIWGEQGVGDEILFGQCVADAVQAGARVIVECEPRLAPLFLRSFPGIEVHGKENPPHPRLLQNDIDCHIPMGSLVRWFRPAVEHFPCHDGYFRPDAGRLAHWREWLDGMGPGPRVGISWRSMKRGGERDSFYTTLAQWGDIFRLPGIVFVNLQYGECRDELEEARRLFGVEIHEAPGLNLKDELDDAAALTRALDLVIAPNTSVFAMAGAVGTPTWLLNLDSDWTMLGTDHMPWFPSVKVYRKRWADSWETLLARVASDLAREVK